MIPKPYFRKLLFYALTFTLLLAACLPVGQLDFDIETPGATTAPPTNAPAENAQPTETPTLVVTEEPTPTLAGTVTGKACYPSEVIPVMDIYFRNVTNGELTALPIAENQSTYSVALPAGTYEAFAYPQNGENGGMYSQAVLCGLTVECVDHSLIAFEVVTGQTTPDIDLCDWYAPIMVPINPKASIVADAALAGLTYVSLASSSVWRVNTNGQATPVLAWGNMGTIVSPDGNQAIYFKNDDVWLADLTTGTWRNITNTPDRIEYPAFWVPGTDLVGVSSHNPAEDSGLPTWQLTFVRLDGSSYEIVDLEGGMWGSPAISPNGDLAAYDVSGQARLYRIGSGVEGFDPAQYGLTGVEKISAPAFSPDGTKLAWWVNGALNGGSNQTALAVFDLSGGSVMLLYTYTPISGEGYSNPVWSPDGQWLASNVIGLESRGALWVFKADGTEVQPLGNGANPVWSPGSNALVFIQWTDGPAWQGILNRVLISDWMPAPLSLPPGTFPIAWMSE